MWHSSSCFCCRKSWSCVKSHFSLKCNSFCMFIHSIVPSFRSCVYGFIFISPFPHSFPSLRFIPGFLLFPGFPEFSESPPSSPVIASFVFIPLSFYFPCFLVPVFFVLVTPWPRPDPFPRSPPRIITLSLHGSCAVLQGVPYLLNLQNSFKHYGMFEHQH